MKNDGFDNEINMLKALNNKKFEELNENLQKMIKYIYKDKDYENSIIYAFKLGGLNKTDLILEINNERHNISIKKGSGNSVHQEKVEDFIKFLKETYNINEELSNNIRLFIWGDGTLDGSGNVEDRLSSNEFKKQFPKIVIEIKNFFHDHKRDLIERFIIKGPKSESIPDYIYYGTPNKGYIIKSELVLNWLSDDDNEKKNTVLPIGRLTFQAWNRNINGGTKSEQKRGVIQLKWSSIGEDLKLISGAYDNE